MAARKEDREEINMMADTLKKILDGMGIDSIVGPHNTSAYIGQATRLDREIREDLGGNDRDNVLDGQIIDENGDNSLPV